MSLSKLRSLLYRAGRAAGDIQAVRRNRVGRRIERRLVGRFFSRILSMLFRGRR